MGTAYLGQLHISLNKSEDMHLNIRQDIYEEAFRRINILPNVEIDTERGRFKFRDYIPNIKNLIIMVEI